MADRPRIAFHSLRVSHVRRLTDNAVCVSFDVPRELRTAYDFTPGQYLTIRATVYGQRMLRRYSICSPARSGMLQIGVKRRAEGRFSAYVVESLRAGDVLDVMTPMGTFTAELDADSERHCAAVAVGSGITPVRSIVTSVLAHEPRSRVTLLYANRTRHSTMFLDDLDELHRTYRGRFDLVHLLSEEPTHPAGLRGRLDPDRLAEIVSAGGLATTVDLWFLCGPYELMEALGGRLVAHGIDADAVRTESFEKAASMTQARA
ncbi:MAG TPA: FAD-binding oxidoreductase [Kribbellaceae bacterium]|nr:FAD-binding oxidoreductase [Kribbellaceae bacterium]